MEQHQRIETILRELRDALAEEGQAYSGAAAAEVGTRLLQISKPAQTMTFLAPILFRPRGSFSQHDDGENMLSSADALKLLSYLVTVDPAQYLKAASRAVKEEALRLTNAMSDDDDDTMYVSPELTSVMVAQLSDSQDVETAQNALETVVACCKQLGSSYREIVLPLLVQAWQRDLARMASTKFRAEASTGCVRCATAVVEIALLDGAAMQAVGASGSLDLFVGMLQDESDPLLQMSFLDLLEKMASTRPMHHERATWLFSPGVLKPILQFAGGFEEGSEPDPILGGPSLRVVAGLCKLSHQDADLLGDVGSVNGHLIQAFHRALHNFEITGELDRLALIDAISSFAGASADAMDLVLDDPVTQDAWLSLSVAQPKLKSAILMSVAMVLDPASEVDSMGDQVQVKPLSNEKGMKLFATLGTTNGEEATELLLSMAKSPLPETRLGAYTLLAAVAKLRTGGQVLFTNGGFYEFLMDRDRERTKEGREAKYAVVQALLASEVKGLLAEEIVRELEKYISQGPHYVQTLGWEVAEQ